MDMAPRDEVSSKNTLPPEETARLIGKITGRPAALEIPTFDRGWHPNEITRWLDEVENDESVSDEDLARARQAVSEALGVDA
ncbi:hypothetical protein [Streptomyces microflavus]|uniref:hypothetical protein n=1 Tax=Streptomyces microflavus TaxID=1919 RepID=UPI0036E12115